MKTKPSLFKEKMGVLEFLDLSLFCIAFRKVDPLLPVVILLCESGSLSGFGGNTEVSGVMETSEDSGL